MRAKIERKKSKFVRILTKVIQGFDLSQKNQKYLMLVYLEVIVMQVNIRHEGIYIYTRP